MIVLRSFPVTIYCDFDGRCTFILAESMERSRMNSLYVFGSVCLTLVVLLSSVRSLFHNYCLARCTTMVINGVRLCWWIDGTISPALDEQEVRFYSYVTLKGSSVFDLVWGDNLTLISWLSQHNNDDGRCVFILVLSVNDFVGPERTACTFVFLRVSLCSCHWHST